MSFLRIRADEKPLSTIPLRTVIKIRQIPIKPYSAGESKRARTKPTTKEMPCPRKASAADQIVPLMVLPFSDEADIDGGYLMFSIWLIQALKWGHLERILVKPIFSARIFP